MTDDRTRALTRRRVAAWRARRKEALALGGEAVYRAFRDSENARKRRSRVTPRV